MRISDWSSDVCSSDLGGAKVAEIAALPARLAPLAEAARRAGSAVMSTHFTLVHGVDGEPFVSEHLKRLRPFLRAGVFAAGGWGHDLVDALKPANFRVEKVEIGRASCRERVCQYV